MALLLVGALLGTIIATGESTQIGESTPIDGDDLALASFTSSLCAEQPDTSMSVDPDCAAAVTAIAGRPGKATRADEPAQAICVTAMEQLSTLLQDYDDSSLLLTPSQVLDEMRNAAEVYRVGELGIDGLREENGGSGVYVLSISNYGLVNLLDGLSSRPPGQGELESLEWYVESLFDSDRPDADQFTSFVQFVEGDPVRVFYRYQYWSLWEYFQLPEELLVNRDDVESTLTSWLAGRAESGDEQFGGQLETIASWPSFSSGVPAAEGCLASVGRRRSGTSCGVALVTAASEVSRWKGSRTAAIEEARTRWAEETSAWAASFASGGPSPELLAGFTEVEWPVGGDLVWVWKELPVNTWYSAGGTEDVGVDAAPGELPVSTGVLQEQFTTGAIQPMSFLNECLLVGYRP
ncbi:MAG: hypothetical protein RLZZ272_111 [Actinomycetota bacterium]|jgi:hypothetical protein